MREFRLDQMAARPLECSIQFGLPGLRGVARRLRARACAQLLAKAYGPLTAAVSRNPHPACIRANPASLVKYPGRRRA